MDNPSRTKYDMRSNDEFIVSVFKNDLDIYFILDTSIKNVIYKYYQLTGFPFLPSKWSLGHHLSKHSYENTNVVKELIEKSIESKIKLDAIYLDILYMQEYKSFTVDKARYENLAELVKYCQSHEVEIVPIVNPGVKADEKFSLFNLGKKMNAFIKQPDGKTIYQGEVWPGQCAFPDFFNKNGWEFWKKCFEFYLSKNIHGVWLDMNEPAVFNDLHVVENEATHIINNKQVSHEEIHNNYGTYEAKATYEIMSETNLRPHLVSRAFSAGIQKYSTVWTGDNFSYWFQLQQSLPMVMNLSLSGVPFTGQDLGGFEYDCSAELLTRWYQANILFGLFRNHCSINKRAQEPWTFDEETTKAIAKAVEFRNQYLPTLYNQAYLVHKFGASFVTPLFYNFETDLKSYNIDDQYMVANLMVAPILKKNTYDRLVYLPDNETGWVDLNELKYFAPNQNIIKHIAYDELGIFVLNNSMLFKMDASQKKSGLFKQIEVEIYNFNNHATPIVGSYYDDDGLTIKVEKNFEHFKFCYSNQEVIVESLNKNLSYKEIKEKFKFILINEQGKNK
ncbi:glycoside hydrolase family 31 protein [Spiroplasma clarkii]|uniref:glycoside hydrolase family 31 protein n=1 Tax=Spiroplasma clarkii TaxID=2139 RepID=UPI0011BA58BE|nr:glycoside hydrolase family 31 protein [Spiroplasma clarkii]